VPEQKNKDQIHRMKGHQRELKGAPGVTPQIVRDCRHFVGRAEEKTPLGRSGAFCATKEKQIDMTNKGERERSDPDDGREGSSTSCVLAKLDRNVPRRVAKNLLFRKTQRTPKGTVTSSESGEAHLF